MTLHWKRFLGSLRFFEENLTTAYRNVVWKTHHLIAFWATSPTTPMKFVVLVWKPWECVTGMILSFVAVTTSCL